MVSPVGHQARHAGFEHDVLHRVQVHAGVLEGPWA
jgi:hypothetical protein